MNCGPYAISYKFKLLYTLYTVYCRLKFEYCILYTVLYTVYCILYTVYCILYTVYCIPYTAQGKKLPYAV